MHERCPACGIRFAREEGYFFGSMYVSYLLGIPLIAALTALLKLTLLADWEVHWVVLPAFGLFVFFVPAVFRYSRVVWMHVDRMFHPDRSD